MSMTQHDESAESIYTSKEIYLHTKRDQQTRQKRQKYSIVPTCGYVGKDLFAGKCGPWLEMMGFQSFTYSHKRPKNMFKEIYIHVEEDLVTEKHDPWLDMIGHTGCACIQILWICQKRLTYLSKETYINLWKKTYMHVKKFTKTCQTRPICMSKKTQTHVKQDLATE